MKSDQEQELKIVRDNIDSIDNEILSLLKNRLNCAKEIGRIKAGENRAKWDPLRERQIYYRLIADNEEIFPKDALKSI